MPTSKSCLPIRSHPVMCAGGFRPLRKRSQFSAMFIQCKFPFLILSLAVSVAGCASDRERVALESELRGQESRIRDLEKSLSESNTLIKDQDAELTALRNARTPGTNKPGSGTTTARLVSASTPAERLAAWGSVRGIQIHRLTSGVVPSEDTESSTINVVIQPVDEDGDLVKVAGKLRVTANLKQNGETGRQIAAIEYDLTECRRIWNQGLVSSGLHATLRTTEPISSDTAIQVNATLNLGADRSFKTTEVIEQQ